MIFQIALTSGNLGVQCDQQGCPATYHGKKWKDPTDLPWYTPRNVRRQARKRNWCTVDMTVDGARVHFDYCPNHHPELTGGVDITNEVL